MKICKYCKSEIDKKAKICPNCRKSQTNIFVRLIVGFIGVILIIAGINSLSGENGSIDTKKEETKFDYVIDKAGISNYMYQITGTVKNKKDKNYSYVQIEFSCYDKDGNNLGTAIDNMNNLGPNETWKFKASYFGEAKDVDHCDYKEITSW